jgi:hypothetical protein
MNPAEMGRKGGKSGRGKSKRRGDAAYYRRIAKRRWRKCRAVMGGER